MQKQSFRVWLLVKLDRVLPGCGGSGLQWNRCHAARVYAASVWHLALHYSAREVMSPFSKCEAQQEQVKTVNVRVVFDALNLLL